MPLALSTSWNASRYNDARGLLFEIKQLGFSDLELSYNITGSMAEKMHEALKDLGLNIVSLHNYYPIPEEFEREKALPDCFSLSSLDSAEREQAVKYTKRTIDNASFLGARAVVLHCGRVEMADETRDLISLFENGLYESKEFKKKRDGFLAQRSAIASGFISKILKSLEEIERYSRGKGISIGVENRFYYREIPNFEEIGVILDNFKGSNIFYWHDTGHARVMHNLGFIQNEDLYLENYSKYLLGVHLHNITGCSDHQAPVKGEFDFTKLKPYMDVKTIKVIEAHYPATALEIKDSAKLLGGILNGILQ